MSSGARTPLRWSWKARPACCFCFTILQHARFAFSCQIGSTEYRDGEEVKEQYVNASKRLTTSSRAIKPKDSDAMDGFVTVKHAKPLAKATAGSDSEGDDGLLDDLWSRSVIGCGADEPPKEGPPI